MLANAPETLAAHKSVIHALPEPPSNNAGRRGVAGARGGTSHAKRGPAPPTRPPRAARGAKPWRNPSRDAPGQSEHREPTGARGFADGRPQAGRSADCRPATQKLGGCGQRARVRAWDDRRPSEWRGGTRVERRAREPPPPPTPAPPRPLTGASS